MPYQCDNGHIGLYPAIEFVIGDRRYLACSQQCRNEIEKRGRSKVGEDSQS